MTADTMACAALELTKRLTSSGVHITKRPVEIARVLIWGAPACWRWRPAIANFSFRPRAQESLFWRDSKTGTRGACAPQRNALHCAMFLSHLECTSCGLRHEWSRLENLCTACRKPLFAIYDLDAVGHNLKQEALATREKSLWRYRELLPLPEGAEPVSLGEGGTPLLRAERFGSAVGLAQLWIKDESQNPTQSFKARGMSVAVSMAKHLGASKLVTPSAGNAASALAAYAARAGLEAHVFMPRDTPRANIIECRELGARVTLIDGLITDCAAEIGRRKENWFDVSTLKEPYRIEGKKTLGYELAEQLNWELPDAIIYPTGGGTGLIGMWKAFNELIAAGWVRGTLPRLYTVQ